MEKLLNNGLNFDSMQVEFDADDDLNMADVEDGNEDDLDEIEEDEELEIEEQDEDEEDDEDDFGEFLMSIFGPFLGLFSVYFRSLLGHFRSI